MRTVLLLLMLTASYSTAAQTQQVPNNQQIADQTKKVCIVGNVIRQREIVFDKLLTVTEAIKQAGGIRPDRRENKILVISEMVGPERRMRVIYVDLKAIKKRSYLDFELQDRDIVE